MLVYFNGDFIEAQSYQLMMSLVGIVQAQVALKGVATAAPSSAHAVSGRVTTVPANAVRVPSASSQGALPVLPYQAQWTVEVKP